MREQVDRLLTELGPLLDPDEIVGSENGWLIVLDENHLIDIDFESDLNRILLSTQVGHIDESRAELTYRQLLQYNTLWSATGGLRFALTDDSTQVTLMVELPVPELHVQLFLTIIKNFLEISSNWKTVITQKPERKSDEDTQPDELSYPSIKV